MGQVERGSHPTVRGSVAWICPRCPAELRSGVGYGIPCYSANHPHRRLDCEKRIEMCGRSGPSRMVLVCQARLMQKKTNDHAENHQAIDLKKYGHQRRQPHLHHLEYVQQRFFETAGMLNVGLAVKHPINEARGDPEWKNEVK